VSTGSATAPALVVAAVFIALAAALAAAARCDGFVGGAERVLAIVK
jgi:hypothetical protein